MITCVQKPRFNMARYFKCFGPLRNEIRDVHRLDERGALLESNLVSRRENLEKLTKDQVAKWSTGMKLVRAKKIDDAMKLLEQLASEDIYEANVEIGNLEEKHYKKFASAKKQYAYAAEKAGDFDAYLGLARLAYQGLGEPQAINEARAIYEVLAKRGDPVANHMLGVFHRDGIGCATCHETAITFFKRSYYEGHNYWAGYALGELLMKNGKKIRGLIIREYSRRALWVLTAFSPESYRIRYH